jgi:hypothetical protein
MAILAMMLFACNNSSYEKSQDIQLPDQSITQNNSEEPKQQPVADTATTPTFALNHSSPNNNDVDWDKRRIKIANLRLQLDDYKKFNASVHNSVKQFGAYVAGEKQEESDYKIENSLTIKVPVAQFEDLVNSFSGDGIKIAEKNISSEDVTSQVVDTRARMQAKIAVRDKYIELLKQAKNMNEILQVQNEINNMQENIEAANSRVNYLQHASAYSTINLNYYQYINGSTGDEEKPDFFTKLTRAFSTGTSFIVNLVLFIISIWPLMLGGIVFWIYLKRFRLKKA